MKPKELPDYDIAIIGGGASGIYTAWRMLLEGYDHSPKIKKWIKERGSLKIAVFEGSDRIGGRVLSAKAPGLPDIVCEIGGMRYVSSQTLVKSLVENKLKLKRHQQAVDEPNNLSYLRGKRLRGGDLTDPSKLPYHFSEEENEWLKKVPYKNSAVDFLGYAVEKIFPDIKENIGPNLSHWLKKEWLKNPLGLNPHRTPLYKIGLWNLIAPILSHEAYKIALSTVGYDILGYNSNAIDAICILYDFVPGVEYSLLDDGFDSMLWNMQEQFENAGGEVLMNKWLKSFDETRLYNGSKGVSFQFKEDPMSYSARALVLAMPPRSISLLEQKGPILDPSSAHRKYVDRLLNAVEGCHLYKMFIAYDTPWWEKEGVTEGRSLTDIPIRQCYYWGKEADKKNPKNTNAIIMVYNSGQNADFWGGLRHIPLGPGDTQKEIPNKFFDRKPMPFTTSIKEHNPWDQRLRKNWNKRKAPMEMVKEMHRQLKELHNVEDAPEPLEAAFMDWGDDPYGGAVHFWNPGYDSIKVLEEIIHPVSDFPCYICGEAYSTNQTWVEGALQTAELVLEKFNIPQPKWITHEK